MLDAHDKMCFERKAGITSNWLASDGASTFLLDLLSEMMISFTPIEVEKFWLVTAQIGVNFDQLKELAKKNNEAALNNVSEVFDCDSDVMEDLS